MVQAKRLFVYYSLIADLEEDPQFLYENHWSELHEVSFLELKTLLANEVSFQSRAVKRQRLA